MFTTEFTRQLFQDLGYACGFNLTMVEGSFSSDEVFASATARSWEPPREGSRLCMNIRAQLLSTSNDEGGSDIWALVFFYINGARVAPTGFNHLTLKWETGVDGISRWVVRGWEADVYEEWAGAECLEDDDCA